METANVPPRLLRCLVLTISSLTFPATAAFAQATSPAPADLSPSLNDPAKDRGPTPHTEDGKPDLSGTWAPNAIRQKLDIQAALKEIDKAIPFQPWAEELYLERKANFPKDGAESRCLPPGGPRMTTAPYPFRIVQTPKLMIMLYEGGAQVWRQIYMDGRQHPADCKPTRHGHSIGHWEGDTLVVDSVGFNGQAWLDEAGLPTTESLHLIERFRRPDSGHLEIENVIDDPKAYTKSWSFITYPLVMKGELMEYVCREKDVQHLAGHK